MKKAMKKQGFTLIELMVVVIIVGILAAVAVPLMSANKDRAMASEAIAALGTMNTAARMYQVSAGSNFKMGGTATELETAGFLKGSDFDGQYFNWSELDAAVYNSTSEKFEITSAAIKSTQGADFKFSWDAAQGQYVSTAN